MSDSLLSAPASSLDAMLNMRKVELELISDADMYSFFEKSMRGGVSYIFNKYNPKHKSIQYAISKFLVAGKFK